MSPTSELLENKILLSAYVFKINPSSTFYKTDGPPDPDDPNSQPIDPASDTVPIDLANLGIQGGEYIRLTILGDFSYRQGEYADAYADTTGVFSSSNKLLPQSELHRVDDALDAGSDVPNVTTYPTYFNGESTDISEDFGINDITIRVPRQARYLFVSARDVFYSDNVDLDGDYAVKIAPAVLINNTADGSDDITVLTPGTQANPNNAPIIRAVLSGPDGGYDVSVDPPSHATLVTTNPLNLVAGRTASVDLIPRVASDAPNRLFIVLSQNGVEITREDMTIAFVSIAGRGIVDADTTPAEMRAEKRFRIPPKVNTEADIVVTPDLTNSGGQSITFVVTGQNVQHGFATFVDSQGTASPTIQVSGSGKVLLRGTSQTIPGFAGKLQLAARVGGQDVALSQDGFSVAAIPIGVEMELHKKGTLRTLAGGNRIIGAQVKYRFLSDSKDESDLNMIEVSEEIETDRNDPFWIPSGSFAGVALDISGFQPALPKPGFLKGDTHGTEVVPNGTIRVGRMRDFQTFKFRDRRTGAGYGATVPIANSGFVIEHTLTADTNRPGRFIYKVVKRAARTTAHGVTSDGGATVGSNIEAEVDLP